ncbi:MAG: DUF3347 domain-containing protein [Bacteroidetes bacterium]|nr:MAG: DUF3347 domain-containing protein [Bacteroidota bacterium]
MSQMWNGIDRKKTITKNFIIMERTFVVFIAIGALVFSACNSGDKSPKENDMSKMNADTSKKVIDTSAMKEVSHSFTNVDPKLASSLKSVVDHYLHIKNGLVNNSGSEAADGGKQMADALDKVDKSLFTAEQKKVYDDIDDDLKEHAEHIGRNASNIAHQRDHFEKMSEDVYDLVTAFGGGQTLYHDQCPMANDNKGAMWLSEMREIKNPYFGGKMNECVKVPEVIK